MTTTWGRRHSRGLLTFYHSGLRRCSFCAWCHGFDLREGSGLLDSKCRIFFSRCRVGFISFPGQISRLPAQCKIGGQPSKTTKLQVLFGKVFTYKLDRTMVTVGAPSMLAMSTSPASVGASSVACAATGFSAPVVVLASGLLSSAGSYCSTTLIVCCVICATSSSTVGLDCDFFQSACPPCPSHLLPLCQQGRKMESPATTQNSIC
jgi:hypothetical protein